MAREVVVGPLRLEQIGPFASRTIIARVAMMAGVVEGADRAGVGAILLDPLEQDSNEIAAALGWQSDARRNGLRGQRWTRSLTCWRRLSGSTGDFSPSPAAASLQAKLPAEESTASPT